MVAQSRSGVAAALKLADKLYARDPDQALAFCQAWLRSRDQETILMLGKTILRHLERRDEERS